MCPTHNTVHMFGGGRNVLVVDDVQFDDVHALILRRKGLQLLYTRGFFFVRSRGFMNHLCRIRRTATGENVRQWGFLQTNFITSEFFIQNTWVNWRINSKPRPRLAPVTSTVFMLLDSSTGYRWILLKWKFVCKNKCAKWANIFERKIAAASIRSKMCMKQGGMCMIWKGIKCT